MKIPKEAKDDARKFVDENSEVTVEDIVRIFKAKADAPDVPTLIDREFRNAARRFLASQRDRKGSRKLFAVERSGRFTNIERTDDVIDLLAINDGLTKIINGCSRERKKVQNRLKVISGQMSVTDWLESIGETDMAKAK